MSYRNRLSRAAKNNNEPLPRNKNIIKHDCCGTSKLRTSSVETDRINGNHETHRSAISVDRVSNIYRNSR